MLFIWLPGERIQVLMDQSVPSVLFFSVFIFNAIVPSGCFIFCEGQNSELQIFERYRHEERTSLVEYKEGMGGETQKRNKTEFRRHLRLLFTQPLKQIGASLILMMFLKKPQVLSICIQAESSLDHAIDFKHLCIWANLDLFVGY